MVFEVIHTQKAWDVEILENIQSITPSRSHPEKTWLTTHFILVRPDGTSEEVESSRTMLRIKNIDGVSVEVSAFAAHHIIFLHAQGGGVGSTLKSESLESAWRTVAEHLPRELPFIGDVAAFAIDLGQITGIEGVSTLKEMVEKSVATQDDVDLLATMKDEAFRLNLQGSDEEKKAFVDASNAKCTGKVRLGIRGGAITPFFTAEKQPTSKMFLAIVREKDVDDSEHIRVRTMAPGRYMDMLPTDDIFTGKEGATIADLLEKSRRSEDLSPEERVLVEKQRVAQECWWNGGFVVEPGKK